MQIYQEIRGSRLDAKRHSDGTYHCYPKSENNKTKRKTFETLIDAALFLIENPDWGIQMSSGGGIIYKDIVIIRR